MKTGTFTAMIFLIMVSIAHILRFITQVDIVVGTYSIPIWMSWAAIILTLVLSIAIWKEQHSS